MQQQDGRGVGRERSSGLTAVQRKATEGLPGKRTLVEQEYGRGISATIQRQPASGAEVRSGDSEASTKRIHAAPERGLEGSGGTLPHLHTIQRLFGRHDVSGVSAHVGGPAEQACQNIGALQLKGGVGTAGDAYERHADAVADRVVAGQSAESMLDAYAGAATGPAQPVTQRKHDGAAGPIVQQDGKHVSPRPTSPPEHSRVGRLIELLNTPDPVAGVGDYDGAFAFLNGLSMADLLATISGAADCGYLAPLLAHSYVASAYDRARLMSALYAVELAGAAPSRVNHEELNRAGVELDQIPRDQQLRIFEYILNRRGSSISVTTLMEGIVAMHDGKPAAAGAGGGGPTSGGDPTASGGAIAGGGGTAAGTSAPSPIEPSPWAPQASSRSRFTSGTRHTRGSSRNIGQFIRVTRYVAMHFRYRVSCAPSAIWSA